MERVDEDGNAVGFVQVAGKETDALAIANDTERVIRESVSAGRGTRLLNGLLNDLPRLLQPRGGGGRHTDRSDGQVPQEQASTRGNLTVKGAFRGPFYVYLDLGTDQYTSI